MTTPSTDGRDGFILVETIVAFAILAVALGVSMQTISQSAAMLGRASDTHAAGLAFQALAAKEFGMLKDEGEFSGQLASGEPWRITARFIRDNHARPLLVLSASVWPRGSGGPVYSYQTFVSNPRQQLP